MIPMDLEELFPDGKTHKNKIYGSECINCNHRKGVHFISLEGKGQSCNGYGEQPCNCTRYR